jgi:sulfoxide reductase heme-binding subunit YedZ
MAEDITMRPFITLGMATYVMLIALAVTSTQTSIRRLGRKWTQLHRLVYVAAVTSLLHFWLARKTVVPQFQVVLVAAVLLLGFRIWWAARQRTPPRPAAPLKPVKM